jgi:hypothetical protein
MALMTPDTFDPLRRYVGVRLQQGVVIVDADENEREDIRQFELRAFLKWFVGDGVPEGNDGFRIVGTGAANDFQIQAGVLPPPPGMPNVERGLRRVGRCLVDGLDVIIESDTTFVAQPLHNSHANAGQLAAALNSSVIFPPPNINGNAAVFLDVWRRLVTPTEDPTLVHPGLGTESCARFKREWAVRVRGGASAPVAGDPDFITGHSYYLLAIITRRIGDPNINASDVADAREQRLLLPPAQLIEDTLGVVVGNYRRGQGRPVVNLRAAINALLHGRLPMTPEQAIAPSPANLDQISRATLFDTPNAITTFWTSDRVGGITHIFSSRVDTTAANPTFGAAQQITAGVARRNPHAALLDTGQVLLVYESQTAPGNEDVHLKRAVVGGLNAAPEIPVAADPVIRERAPFVVNVGAHAIILWHEAPSNTWQFNRYVVATNNFPNPKTQLSATVASAPGSPFDLHAVRDNANNVWVAYRSNAGGVLNIHTVRILFNGAPTDDLEHDSGGGGIDSFPFLMLDNANGLWLFWNALQGLVTSIRYRRLDLTTNTWDAAVNGTVVPETDTNFSSAPTAFTDPDGVIWLFYSRRPSVGSTVQDIWYTTLDPTKSTWGAHHRLTVAPETDSNSFALRSANGMIWLFWTRLFGVNGELFYRRLITNI